MESRRTRYGHVLRLDPGEDIVQALADFAGREGVRGGMISGIGAVGEVELGFFDPAREVYERRTFRGDHEIGALTGNFSMLEGRPFPHCHIVIAGPDFVAHTGHLFRGQVSVTCEIHVTVEPDPILRVRIEGSAFAPLSPRPRPG